MNILNPTPCGGHTRKHHYRVHKFTDRVAIMRCKWTMCQNTKVLHNDTLRDLVAR